MDRRATRELVSAIGRQMGTPRTRLLQDWTTIRSAGASTFVQDEDLWLDVGGFADVAFWVDVSAVTPPGGSGSTNYLKLTLETAPTCDDAYFQPVASPIWLGTGATLPVRTASPTPFVTKSVRSPGTAALGRYLRWRIDPVNAGAWDVTFRIRAVFGRSSFFTPPQIPGCVLWLRSDLGVVTTVGGTTISSWADQSGLGNTASAGAASPTYSASGGVFDLPRVTTASGANQYMVGNFAAGVTTHTLFAVLGYKSPLSNYASFAGTDGSNTVNSGFAQFSETPTGLTGRAGSGGAFASANTSDITSIGAPGIYSTAADSNANVDLYVNGVSKATTATAFALASCPKYILFGLGLPLQYNFVGDAYEFVLFNTVLNAADRTRVHRYLGARYGIVVP